MVVHLHMSCSLTLPVSLSFDTPSPTFSFLILVLSYWQFFWTLHYQINIDSLDVYSPASLLHSLQMLQYSMFNFSKDNFDFR